MKRPSWVASHTEAADGDRTARAHFDRTLQQVPCATPEAFLALWHRWQPHRSHEAQLTEQLAVQAPLMLPGYCVVCEAATQLELDWAYSDGATPNFRERMVCRGCGLNNRQRFLLGHVRRSLAGAAPGTLYCQEASTPFFEQLRSTPNWTVIGSEYLGDSLAGGTLVDGLRHEDAMALSFPDAHVDWVISNDVFEHVPDPRRAFSECFRVLKPGGRLVFSVPFYASEARTSWRARLVDGQLQHLKEPEYHGNPLSPDGSLVFVDFGWDMLEMLEQAGFERAYMLAYYSIPGGHVGAGLQYFFVAEKARSEGPKAADVASVGRLDRAAPAFLAAARGALKRWRGGERLVTFERCFICGVPAAFSIDRQATLLREARCTGCQASLRNADTARVLVQALLGRALPLPRAREALAAFDILEAQAAGPIHACLRGLPRYTAFEYLDGVPAGMTRDGVLSNDLQALSFDDGAFDLVVTQDVLEHVADPGRAVREIARVLKPGGVHVFTVPLHEGRPTRSRAGLPPVYHGDPLREGALVHTDWGDDLEAVMAHNGLPTHRVVRHAFHRPEALTDVDATYDAYRSLPAEAYFRYNSIVFVSRKPSR